MTNIWIISMQVLSFIAVSVAVICLIKETFFKKWK